MENSESLLEFARGVDDTIGTLRKLVLKLVENPNKIDDDLMEVSKTAQETIFTDYEAQLDRMEDQWSDNSAKISHIIQRTNKISLLLLQTQLPETAAQQHHPLPSTTNSHPQPLMEVGKSGREDVGEQGTDVGKKQQVGQSGCVRSRLVGPTPSSAQLSNTPDYFRSESCSVAFTPRLFPSGPSSITHNFHKSANSKAKSLRF